MKYEVGDVVKIKDDLVQGREYGRFLCDINRKQKYSGGIIKIKEIHKGYEPVGGYYEVGTLMVWTDEMIERKATTKEKIDNDYSDIEYGDKVKVLDGGCGAFGANDKEGVLVKRQVLNSNGCGLSDNDIGLTIECDNGQEWKIRPDSKLEKIEKSVYDNFGLKGIPFEDLHIPSHEHIDEEAKRLRERLYAVNEWDVKIDSDGLHTDDIVIGNWEEQIIKEENNMPTDFFDDMNDNVEFSLENPEGEDNMELDRPMLDFEVEGKFKVEPVDNGGIVTVTIGDKETKIKGDFIEETLSKAVGKVIGEIEMEKYEEKNKEEDIAYLEKEKENLEDILDELKSE